jgi:hypothetical protein
MRSIPLAMTWELLHRGRWWLIGAMLCASALPAIIFAALANERGFDPHFDGLIVIHVVMMQINMFIFGAAVFAAQGHPSRLYTYPVSNSTIVAWHLLPAMAVMALETLVSTAALNAVFDLGWPLWGPAIFLTVMLAAINAVFWLTEKSAWVAFAIGAVAAVLGCWFKSRFGPVFSEPTHFWTEVTAGEFLTMLAIGVLAYAVAVVAVARNRRGALLPALGIVAWIERTFDPAPELGVPFRSAAHAQFWFEWRRKGWFMPGALAIGVFGASCVWLVLSRRPQDILFGLFGGGVLLPLFGFIGGIVIGNVGPADSDHKMAQFLAMRPMTTGDMARTILKAAARSVLIAWGIWAAAILAVYAILTITISISAIAAQSLPWWFIPATLLGNWIVMAVGAAIRLTGRLKPLLALFLSVISLPIAIAAIIAIANQRLLGQGVATIIGVGFVLATMWAFNAARRRALIGSPTLLIALIGWIALGTLAAVPWPLYHPTPLGGYIFILGLLALAVAPLATFPLALAWNRTR